MIIKGAKWTLKISSDDISQEVVELTIRGYFNQFICMVNSYAVNVS